MQHWYVYHSRKTMGHSYQSRGEPAVYSRTDQPSLCFNDLLWVIEGSLDSSTEFSLVDCFQYKDTKYAPFTNEYFEFKVKFLGDISLLSQTHMLNDDSDGFRRLHSKFLTKQRFFNRLNDHPVIISYLELISGIKI